MSLPVCKHSHAHMGNRIAPVALSREAADGAGQQGINDARRQAWHHHRTCLCRIDHLNGHVLPDCCWRKGEPVKMSKPKILAILGAKDGQFPKTVITLLDIMREINVHNIFQWERAIIGKWEETKKPSDAKLSGKEQDEIHKFILAFFIDDCEKLGWQEADRRLYELKFLLNSKVFKKIPRKLLSAESVHQALHEFHLAILDELESRKFVMIENKKKRVAGTKKSIWDTGWQGIPFGQ